MSSIQEVNSSPEKNELSRKVQEVGASVENMEMESLERFNSIYKGCNTRYYYSENFIDELKRFTNEINSHLEQARSVIMKLRVQDTQDVHIKSLQNMNKTIVLLNKISTVNEKLQTSEGMMARKAYLGAVTAICQAQKLLREIPDRYMTEMLQAYHLFVVKKKAIFAHLSLGFQNIVVQSCNEAVSTLKIIGHTSELQEVLLALYRHSPTIYCLNEFKQFLCNFVTRIVENVTCMKIWNDDDYNILQITVINSSNGTNYLEVYSSLKTFIEFLRFNFNFQIGEGVSSLKYLGSGIGDCLLKILIKNCLEVAIISEGQDHQKYKQMILETENFVGSMISFNILSKNQAQKLIYHVNSLELIFTKKKCSELYMQCLDILQKDPNDAENLEIPVPFPDYANLQFTQHSWCSVSKNCIELGNLLESILDLSLTVTSHKSSHKLLETVQNVLITFGGTTVTDKYDTVPQVPRTLALLHNNCCYFIHKLTEWNRKYIPKLSRKIDEVPRTLMEVDQDDSSEEVTYVNGFGGEIANLQLIACDYFEGHVFEQSSRIGAIVSLLKIPHNPQAYLEIEACVKRCMVEILKLKAAWYKVLPNFLYNRSMGKVLHNLYMHMATTVTMCQKIPRTAAEKFCEGFKELAWMGPGLFTIPSEIGAHVIGWYKFNELIFMFEASLADIERRWDIGRGPLAQYMKIGASELVRALHEDNPRRAAVLAVIEMPPTF